MKMDIESYIESMKAGLHNPEEIRAEVEEMKKAKVGTIKPNYWEKLSENEFEIYEL